MGSAVRVDRWCLCMASPLRVAVVCTQVFVNVCIAGPIFVSTMSILDALAFETTAPLMRIVCTVSIPSDRSTNPHARRLPIPDLNSPCASYRSEHAQSRKPCMQTYLGTSCMTRRFPACQAIPGVGRPPHRACVWAQADADTSEDDGVGGETNCA